MASQDLLVARDGPVLTLTLNRPEQRNSMSPDIVGGLSEQIAGAAEAGVRVVVITGMGDKAFCAGADLAVGTGTFLHDYASPTMPLADLMREVRAAPLPVVARR